MADERGVGPDKGHGEALRSLREHIEMMEALTRDSLPAITRGAAMIITALHGGGKILLCGNGGSAADAQHIAAELVGRFERARRPYPALALTTDTSALTAIGNDFGFDDIFARQVEALAAPGDVLVALSASGTSTNVLAAAKEARGRDARVIALTGAGGQRLAACCDLAIMVPSTRTARIQEAHITIGHIWCELVDAQIGR
jgi:phosphoheptose isomerase